jgi:hypothetical protein
MKSIAKSMLFLCCIPLICFAASMQVHLTSGAVDSFKLADIDNITFSDDTTAAFGTIAGTVVSASTGLGLSGVTIKVYSGTTVVATGTTTSSGTYSISVPVGTNYTVVFTVNGYLSVTYYNFTIIANQSIYFPTIRLVASSTATGTVSGTITNSFTGLGVSGLTIKFRSGINNTTGTVVATTTTGANGLFSFASLVAGTYTAEISGTGYITTSITITCIGGQTVANQNASISPTGLTGQWRFILTWGATPTDLDAHLTGPDSITGNRFHVYFDDKTPAGSHASLDIDNTESYGPESITLSSMRTGVYRFSVHDYIDRNASTSTALGSSGAQVKVYYESTLMKTYNVPNTAGTLWTVFTISGTTITDVNSMSYESSSGSVSKTKAGTLSGSDGTIIAGEKRK